MCEMVASKVVELLLRAHLNVASYCLACPARRLFTQSRLYLLGLACINFYAHLLFVAVDFLKVALVVLAIEGGKHFLGVLRDDLLAAVPATRDQSARWAARTPTTPHPSYLMRSE